MAVHVGVVGESEIETVLPLDQSGHGEGRGAVHADFAVPIDADEPEGGINGGVYDLEIQPVSFRDQRPVGDGGVAQRVHSDLQVGGTDRFEVEDGVQASHIQFPEVEGLGGRGGFGPGQGLTADAGKLFPQEFVGAGLDFGRDIGISRAAVGRVVFEAAVLRRVVGRGDNDSVGESGGATRVVIEDGEGNRRGGGEAVPGVVPQLDSVGRKNLDGRGLGWFRQSVGVRPDEKRAVDPRFPAVLGDRLADGGDVIVVEREI